MNFEDYNQMSKLATKTYDDIVYFIMAIMTTFKIPYEDVINMPLKFSQKLLKVRADFQAKQNEAMNKDMNNTVVNNKTQRKTKNPLANKLFNL